MKQPIIISESTLTDRYQTTIPEPIRKALHLHKREKIRFTILSDGNVLLSHADEGKTDAILDNFLNFLANDINQHPENLKTLNHDLISRINVLISDVDIDLDAPLPEKDE